MYFSIIGNDNRMDYVAEQLYSLGCEVVRELSQVVNGSAIILPPPIKNDYYQLLLPHLNNTICIYGGYVSQEFISSMWGKVPVINYLSFPELVWENAILTAKGIVKEAILKFGYIDNMDVVITGYGYCGKAIALELKKYNCNIFVAVRNHKLKLDIESSGYNFMDMKLLSNQTNKNIECVFNTVPAPIINKAVIDNLSDSVVIFDIASKPGGVDFSYCSQKGIYAILSLGIPGRDFPKEAGYLIADACYNHYINHFI